METKCKHYFCQTCALDRYAKNSTCAACGKQTFGMVHDVACDSFVVYSCVWYDCICEGVFNVATKLCELIEKRRKREADAALAAARAADGEESDPDMPSEE